MQANLWIIAGLPLVAALVTAFLGPRVLRERSHWPTVIALGLAALLSLACLMDSSVKGPVVSTGYEWLGIGTFSVKVILRYDALTAVMLATVTVVSFLVSVFSIGYMQGEPGYPRYFAAISLFVFCMLMLVMASNFLLLFVFWEGVGLCSYLLIGFWFSKPAAASAARKAFLVNRIGDFGFILGAFLIWTTFGSLNFDEVFLKAQGWATDQIALIPGTKLPVSETITVICLLLMLGAAGKSAQLPLYVWLPDAMEGPTPVSALIHAATMVTAGVYMVARCTPLFVLSPEAQMVVGVVGGLTALLAALIALTQTDLKRVMAYSTVSQLGYMFMALGAGAAGRDYVTFAVVAAIFHLFTHAFFKALLFLGSGSVMHAMHHVIDMGQFSGLRKALPWTHATFAVGAAALAGLPPLAGFWSKDEILQALDQASHHGPYAGVFQGLLILALATAFLTAFYTARAYFLTFWGPEKFPESLHGERPHESPQTMVGPLVVLAVAAAVVGLALGPLNHAFAHYLEATPYLPEAGHHEPNTSIVGLSILLALAGVGLAATMYMFRPELAGKAAQRWPRAYAWSLNKFFVDEFYTAVVVRPLQAVALIGKLFDQYLVDGLVDAVGILPRGVGDWFLKPVQNGLVQFYALATLLGLAVFVVALVSMLG